MENILWILFFILFPALIIYLCEKFPLIDKLGPVVLCYLIGIILGNLSILPDNFASAQDLLTTLTVPLALPLMFFSMDLRGFKKTAGKALISLFIAGAAIIVSTGVSFFIFKDFVGPESWKMAGMLIGCYTGGTPNLAAIGTALEIENTAYLAVHASDVVVCAFYLLFLLSFAPSLLKKVLPAYVPRSTETDSVDVKKYGDTFMDFKRGDFWPLLKAFGLAVLIMAVGGGLSFIVKPEISMTVAILTITTLSVIASFIPSIRKIRMTFQLGHYVILIFSLVVSSMANVQELVKTAPAVIGYVTSVIVISAVLHTLLSLVFKIDRDTHIITTTAMVYSPPFVPLVAASLKNKEIVITGVLIGVAGWVAGNYLGISVAYLLRNLAF